MTIMQFIALAIDHGAVVWFSIGLGGAYALALGVIVLLLFHAEINAGYLGLVFMLTNIFFLICFSFLVAASASGLDIKIAVGVIDGLVLFGSKLLAPVFLKYLED